MCRIQNSINLNVFEPEAESCQIRQRPEFASDWNRRPSNDCASSQEILGCVREERTSCIDFNSFNVKNEFRLGIEFLFRKSKVILIQWVSDQSTGHFASPMNYVVGWLWVKTKNNLIYEIGRELSYSTREWNDRVKLKQGPRRCKWLWI